MTITVNELTAMLLRYMKSLAEIQQKTGIMDCVITLNPFWGPIERNALTDAAKIAKLNVLAFMGNLHILLIFYFLSIIFSELTYLNLLL